MSDNLTSSHDHGSSFWKSEPFLTFWVDNSAPCNTQNCSLVGSVYTQRYCAESHGWVCDGDCCFLRKLIRVRLHSMRRGRILAMTRTVYPSRITMYMIAMITLFFVFVHSIVFFASAIFSMTITKGDAIVTSWHADPRPFFIAKL